MIPILPDLSRGKILAGTKTNSSCSYDFKKNIKATNHLLFSLIYK